jgi:hypothetical protein
MCAEWADSDTLSRFAALELIEIDLAAGEYRLDDRVERFLEEMLGASEVAQADWLIGLLEEVRRNIDGYRRLSPANPWPSLATSRRGSIGTAGPGTAQSGGMHWSRKALTWLTPSASCAPNRNTAFQV